MHDDVWVGLKASELRVLEDALSLLADGSSARRDSIRSLRLKLRAAEPYPDITVGVHGGLVQWCRGNPFPIRIMDYDGDSAELPDRDQNGFPCCIWMEPPAWSGFKA